MDLEQRVKVLEDQLSALFAVGVMTVRDNTQVFDGRNIQVGKKYGTKIGTEATQKLGFFAAAPIVQPGAISAPSGGTTIDSQARSAITSLINALHNLGLTA